ncbi:MAG TPA: hypothetical protein VJX67_15070 [Blastocatellia bacterium]|nr:hypothetical protein [Blastocatellia bacterium]
MFKRNVGCGFRLGILTLLAWVLAGCAYGQDPGNAPSQPSGFGARFHGTAHFGGGLFGGGLFGERSTLGEQEPAYDWDLGRLGSISVSDSVQMVGGNVWHSDHGINYTLWAISVGIDQADMTMLRRRYASELGISIDATGLPIIGDQAGRLFDSLSFDHALGLTAPIRKGWRRNWCRHNSSVSWETKSLQWRGMKFSAEGSYDLHNHQWGMLGHVKLLSW